MNVIEYGKALYKITRYELLHKLRVKPQQFEENVRQVTKDVQQRGYAIFENYYSPEQCEAMRNEIDRVLAEKTTQVQVDAQGADHRLFGANNASELIHSFWTDPFTTQVRNCFYEHDDIVGCTMAARIQATEENLGSGGGWHRDMIFGRQIKTIAYFSDVNDENGPFQFLENSHTDSSILETIAKSGIGAFQNRLSEAEIERIQNTEHRDVITFKGKAGTLLIVDTTSIHRGKPLIAGTRYALTNYYFESKIPTHINQLIYRP